MRLARAFGSTWRGFAAAWREEEAFRQECLLALVVVPLGLWLGESGVERALLVGPMFLVLVIELVNSAVEATVDRIGSSATRSPRSPRSSAPPPSSSPSSSWASTGCWCSHGGTSLRFARLRHGDGLPGPLPGPHPAGQDPPPERVLRRADAAAQLRRLRGQHRLQPAPARLPGARHGHGRPRLRAVPRVDDAERHVAAAREGARGRVHGAGLHHDRPRREPAHGLPPGRDDALGPAGGPGRRQHLDRRLRAGRARRHDRARDAVRRREDPLHLRPGPGDDAVRRRRSSRDSSSRRPG